MEPRDRPVARYRPAVFGGSTETEMGDTNPNEQDVFTTNHMNTGVITSNNVSWKQPSASTPETTTTTTFFSPDHP